MNIRSFAACFIFLLAAISLPSAQCATAQNFSSGSEVARKFGVHEVVVRGGGVTGNPFDVPLTVTFTPSAGKAKEVTVHAFFDGENTWRARLYVSESGSWRWESRCPGVPALDGKKGAFDAVESKLPGRLLSDPRNPRHWQTENGRWFLNLNDTSYYFLTAYSAYGAPVTDTDAKTYVRDLAERGITSMRSFVLIGPSGYLEDGPQFERRWGESYFADTEFTRLRLNYLRVADERLRFLLNEYPDMKMQLVLFPRGSRHGRDEKFWVNFSPEQKERLMRTFIARYAAYPQIFWLVANDAHYGPKHPNNNAFAREVGEYFRQHDPWRHPMSTGHARKIDFAFPDEDWATYIHLEHAYDVGAAEYEKYHRYAKPVFLGEDRYEHDYPERDPVDMRYFQRRLFWAWTLTGGSTNYGGRWWVLLPYSKTGNIPSPSQWPQLKGHVFTAQLTGLDSVKFIRDYFAQRKIELSEFEPDHGLVADAEGATGDRAPKLMRREFREFLVYHPNATGADRDAVADAGNTPGLRVDLSGANGGEFAIEWFRARDGVAQAAGFIEGGKPQLLRSPWRGEDCVLRLQRK